MATGFTFMLDSVEKDFNDIFEPRGTATAITDTGFQNSSGTDFASIFLSGNSGITTGFQNSSGEDLGSKFEKKYPFTTVGHSVIGTTTGTTRYRYAVFLANTNTKTIVINKNTRIIIICVGAGGSGQYGDNDTGNSGGGGGGVYKGIVPTPTVGTEYNITVGFGGKSFDVNDGGMKGRLGGTSEVKVGTTEWIRCTGGRGGISGRGLPAGGAGGIAYFNGNSQSIGVGGTGGSKPYNLNNQLVGDKGGDGYYSEGMGNSLNVPGDIVTAASDYIRQYYGGGGEVVN